MNHMYVVKIGPNEDFPDYQVPHVIDHFVSVYEGELDDGLNVYPNPADMELTIQIPAGLSSDVSLVNGVGQVVQTTHLNGTTILSVGDLAPGMYYLQTVTEGIANVRKVVIRH